MLSVHRCELPVRRDFVTKIIRPTLLFATATPKRALTDSPLAGPSRREQGFLAATIRYTTSSKGGPSCPPPLIARLAQGGRGDPPPQSQNLQLPGFLLHFSPD